MEEGSYCQDCQKGDLTKSGNGGGGGGTTLMPVAAKVMGKVLIRGMSDGVEWDVKLQKEQTGFRQGRSTNLFVKQAVECRYVSLTM